MSGWGVFTELAGGEDEAGRKFAGEPVMNGNNVILEAEKIYKIYPMGLAKVEVLKGVDLKVQRGEFVAIVGASGSGKSTLLHILGALDRPDSGVVKFEGQDLSRFGGSQLNKFRNKMVGFVFQFYHLLDELTVLENVFLPVDGRSERARMAWKKRMGEKTGEGTIGTARIGQKGGA